MTTRLLCRTLLVGGLSALTAGAGAALGQGTGDWALPAGFTPNPQPSAGTSAAPMTGPITFSEAEFPLATPINGLVVNSIGGTPLAAPLSFSFSSADALVSFGPGTTAFVADPSIEGDAGGALTIDFGLDVTRVAFGFAQNCPLPNMPSVTVAAFDAGAAMIGSTNVAAADFGFFFLENAVDFSPASPARSVQITFDTQGGSCFRFALDNLAYDPVMAPFLPPAALMVLVFLSLAGGVWMLRRRVPASKEL